jgi:hypothetical protein
VIASLLVVLWEAALIAPRHKPDLVWAGALVLLLLGARQGREWAWVLLMTLVTTYATLIVLGNLTDPDGLARRGLPVVVAVAVLGYSLRSAMRTSAAVREKASTSSP